MKGNKENIYYPRKHKNLECVSLISLFREFPLSILGQKRMRRIVKREMPDGSIEYVQPFHISMEGMEKTILCRNDDDYDAMVKAICVCAKRKNVIVIIYAVVSNHCHIAVLASTQLDADIYAQEVKRMYSMWFCRRYGQTGILKHVDIKALCLDTDWYVRNALAYIPRNALDNGCEVCDYRWSGFRAMFREISEKDTTRVSSLTRREREQIMHTGDDLTGVNWLLAGDKTLIPASFCDHRYLEQAFENQESFFLKTIGGLNPAEMQYKLVESPRKRMNDNEFLKTVEDICVRWFQSEIKYLPVEKKIRILPYVFRTTKTTIPQLSRALGLSREMVESALRKSGIHSSA